MTENTKPPMSFTELDREQALQRAFELVTKYWGAFDQARPGQPHVDESLLDTLNLPLPEQGIAVASALEETDELLDKSISQPRPRYFAFVGSSGLEMGVLADVLAATHDINLAVYAGAATHAEQQTLGWIAEFIGFPGNHGTFTSGGMLSNLTALTAARTQALPNSREEGINTPVAVYISRDAHSSIERAVEILGIGSRSIRDVNIDAERRIDPQHLREIIEQDIINGITPIAIVASAGTTLAGAVDPIQEIAAIAQEHNIWLHIDGAYGMPAASTEVAADKFRGLDLADSITIDAHKWLFLPKPCGILLVREKQTLTAAFQHEASYIREETTQQNPVEWTLEYSRPMRALKVWLAFRAYGASAFRSAIARNLAQAGLCASLVQQSPTLELLQKPQLSVVLFRHVPSAQHTDLNAHNKRLASALQADGRVYVAGANVDGIDCVRACFVNYRTQDNDVHVLIDVVNEMGARLAAES